MPSLLDIWESLPGDEKSVITESVLHEIREVKKGNYARDILLPPEWHKYYQIHFGLGMGNVEGSFIGLACGSCRTWINYGHDDDCPMGVLMNGFDYLAADKFISNVRKMDVQPIKNKVEQLTIPTQRHTIMADYVRTTVNNFTEEDRVKAKQMALELTGKGNVSAFFRHIVRHGTIGIIESDVEETPETVLIVKQP